MDLLLLDAEEEGAECGDPEASLLLPWRRMMFCFRSREGRQPVVTVVLLSPDDEDKSAVAVT